MFSIARNFFLILFCCLVYTRAAFSHTQQYEVLENHNVYEAYDPSDDSDGTSFSLFDSFSYIVPVTHRQFINIVPDEYLNVYGKKQYEGIIKDNIMPGRSNDIDRINRVSKRLLNALDKFFDEYGMANEFCNLDWEFTLLKGDIINAFSLPGGKIAVYEKIMPIANDDSSLAIVLSHEIAHVIAKHSSEHISKKLISSVGLVAISMMINNSNMSDRKKFFTKLIATAGITLTNLKFSRQNELEADYIGLILSAMAGYDPSSAITFWENMNDTKSSWGKYDWYSTHPSNSNRIDAIRGFVAKANEYYIGIH